MRIKRETIKKCQNSKFWTKETKKLYEEGRKILESIVYGK